MKLDLGCGPKKKEGYFGVDALAMRGVDMICDLRVMPWPWADNSIDGVYCAHFVEHLTGMERIAFFNELGRILKPGAEAEIITPDWSNASAYGDPTHQWPPMSYWYVAYLDKQWRDREAPHVPYTCDFAFRYGYTLEEWLRNQGEEAKKFAMAHYLGAVRDLQVVLTKRTAASRDSAA
jgi:predicted SAM-dependent methyltransferase